MKTLNKISYKNIKLNKKRTIGTIVGIVLAVSLLCAVATLAVSFRQTLIDATIADTGYTHLKIKNATDENIKIFKQNRDIKDVNVINDAGYAKLDTVFRKDKPYAHIYSLDKQSFKNMGLTLLKGTYPKDDTEIVVNEDVASIYKIGDKITLSIGNRYAGNEVIPSGYEYEPLEWMYDANGVRKIFEETIKTEMKKEFTIVGIMSNNDQALRPLAYKNDAGYSFVTNGIQTNQHIVCISLNDPINYKESISQILGFDLDKEYEYIGKTPFEYEVNYELLRWEIFAFSDSTITMFYAVISIIIAIIITTSVFCIRNSFVISTTEKIQMYGMLASIGATKKQIKRSVLFEGVLLGLIGIPIGVIGGISAVYVLLNIVNQLLEGYIFSSGISFSVSYLSIIISILLGIVTIYFSAISSARKVAKVSPMEQLRGNTEIKINAKKLKTPKIIKTVFKTGGVLAYKNLKRSKKKYRTTIISLTISIFTFISMSGFISETLKISAKKYAYGYNISVEASDSNQDFIDNILQLEDIESYSLLFLAEDVLEVSDDHKMKEFMKPYMSETTDENGKKTNSYPFTIALLDHTSFVRYADQLNLKYEDIKKKAILWDRQMCDDSAECRGFDYQKGDKIKGTYLGKPMQIEIAHATMIPPKGLESTYTTYVILERQQFPSINTIYSQIVLQSKNTQKTVEEIKEINDSFIIVNLEETMKNEKILGFVACVFLYGFIGVITLIGVTNIFNTITSNLELRQKEFAMMKSIGMTKKEFNRMINLETLFYCSKSLFFGILLGVLGSFAIHKAFSIKFDNAFELPVLSILLSIIFVYVLVYIIMKYSMNKINKQNIMETIRKYNI